MLGRDYEAENLALNALNLRANEEQLELYKRQSAHDRMVDDAYRSQMVGLLTEIRDLLKEGADGN